MDRTTNELLEMLGLDASEMSLKVLEVAAANNVLWTDQIRHRCRQVVIDLCRQTLAADHPLARKIESAALLVRLREGRYFELRSNALPNPIHEHPDDIRQELNPIVDRFIELGWTMEQVRNEFLIELQANVSLDVKALWMMALAGAKCFPPNDTDRRTALRKFLPKAWDEFVRIHVRREGIRTLRDFGDIGLWGPEDGDFLHAELVKILSEGHVAFLYQLLGHLGNISAEKLKFEHDEGTTGLPYGNSSLTILRSLAPEAFALAFSQKRYGVAYALSLHFDCVREDLIKEGVESIVSPEAWQRKDAVEEKYVRIRQERLTQIAIAESLAKLNGEKSQLKYEEYIS